MKRFCFVLCLTALLGVPGLILPKRTKAQGQQVTAIYKECYPENAAHQIVAGERFVIAGASDSLETFPSYILLWKQPVDSTVPSTGSFQMPLQAQEELLDDFAHGYYYYHYTLHYAMARTEVLVEFTSEKRNRHGELIDFFTIEVRHSEVPGLDTHCQITTGYQCH